MGLPLKLNSSESFRLPNPMIGFGVPGMIVCVSRGVANEARGHPYFYYGNFTLTPKEVRAQIPRFLHDRA